MSRRFVPANTPAPRALKAAIVTGLFLCHVVTAHAESPPIKPGLWEVTTDSQTLNGKAMPDMSARMAEQMKKLPPEARAQMETQMKARGLQMSPAGSGAMGMRMCLTREMLDQNRWQKPDGRCQNTAMNHSGSTWSWKFSCTQPPSEGEGSTTFSGSDAYVSEMRVTTQRSGQPQTMTMKNKGKWLGADCGDVKPILPPAKP